MFAKQIPLVLFLPAISIGLLSTAVLNLNNMRDRVNDKLSNKNTLVVKMGSKAAKNYHYILISITFILSIIFAALTFKSYFQYLFIIAYIPLVKHLIFVKKNSSEKKLDG